MRNGQIWADGVDRPLRYRHLHGEMIRRIGRQAQDAEIVALTRENEQLRSLLAWHKQRDQVISNPPAKSMVMAAGVGK